MTAAEFEAERQHRERERHEAWWADPKPFKFEVPDEPAELVHQAEAIKAQREHLDAKCGQCGRRRAAHFKPSGHIVGIDHSFVEWCDNATDPLLCKWENGEFVPEAGSAVHDPEAAE